jgi:hypothetical protein
MIIFESGRHENRYGKYPDSFLYKYKYKCGNEFLRKYKYENGNIRI